MQHATAHYLSSGHPIMTSFESGEDWFWDYRTDAAASRVPVDPPLSHPDDQPAPGPAGLVPANWQELLH
jgi:hypothetical protein